jgi:hypothetical protein
MNMPHIIKRQLIDLLLDNESNAFRIQHRFGEHYRNEIVPILESVFYEYCDEDEVLLLDRLEIDLGTITEEALEKNKLEDVLLAAFRASLRENLAALTVHKRFIRRSLPMNSCMQWISYMQKGYLPWNTLQTNESWYQAVLETLATDHGAIAELRRLISEDSRLVRRIVLQHDIIFLRRLTEILTAQNHQQLPSAIEEIAVIVRLVPGEQGLPQPSHSDAIVGLWQRTLILAAGDPSGPSADVIAVRLLQPYVAHLPRQQVSQVETAFSIEVLKDLVQRLLDASVGARELLPSTTQGVPGSRPATNDAEESLKRSSDERSGGEEMELAEGIATEGTGVTPATSADRLTPEEKKEDKGDKNPSGPELAGKREPDPESSATGDPKASIRDSDLGSSPQTLPSAEHKGSIPGEAVARQKFSDRIDRWDAFIPREGLYIRNAGVVLTHPFLGFLFRRLAWLEKNDFVDAEARLKAMFMLHWLATGKTVAAEYELVVCKLLCGYPLNEPLPLAMEFTDEQLTEASDMLTALIQQWPRMENTSVTALREGFLQRGGKLELRNERPMVQVETSGIDVLLDYLTWNLSVIKLPWLDDLVMVEWR